MSSLSNIMSTTPTKFRLAIGKRIRILRAEHDKSQQDLEEATGIHRTTISSYERGNLSLSVESAARIAKAFNMSLSKFFEGIPKIND